MRGPVLLYLGKQCVPNIGRRALAVVSRGDMAADDTVSEYPLGNTPAEDDRLAWQAARFDPLTEKFLRAAGVRTGQRILELGSGAGHVAMLVSRIVGPNGEVVGVERDAGSIARAKVRVADAGLRNVSFTQSDVNDVPRGDPFDAAVGRFILMFLDDPVPVVRSLSHLVRPGGVVAFQEVSWAAFLKRCSQSPLCFAIASLVHDTFQRTGANTEMGPALPAVFLDAGLPAPTMSSTMLLGNAKDLATWLVDLFHIMRPQFDHAGLSQPNLGDLETFPDRLLGELTATAGEIGGPDLVGGWSRIP